MFILFFCVSVLWMVLLEAVASPSTSRAVACPTPGPVTADLDVVDCAHLYLMVTADNVTIAIQRATGSINISSDRPGTTVRMLDSSVSGSLKLRGSHVVLEVRRSTMVGTDVLICTGSRNISIAVFDSSLTGAVVASIVSDVVGGFIVISNSSITATKYAAIPAGRFRPSGAVFDAFLG